MVDSGPTPSICGLAAKAATRGTTRRNLGAMTFASSPRTGQSRAAEYRPVMPPREGSPDHASVPAEAGGSTRGGALHRPRRQAAGVLLLVVVVGVLVLVYRWWRAQGDVRSSSEAEVVGDRPVADSSPDSPDQPSLPPAVPVDDVAAKPLVHRATPRGATSPPPHAPQEQATVRAPWRLGRAPSTTMPPVPAARPAIPGRPRLRLPG